MSVFGDACRRLDDRRAQFFEHTDGGTMMAVETLAEELGVDDMTRLQTLFETLLLNLGLQHGFATVDTEGNANVRVTVPTLAAMHTGFLYGLAIGQNMARIEAGD